MLEYQSQYIINIPMVMRNKIYARAIYVISVAIIVKKEQFLGNQEAYFEMVRKLAYVISQLEANGNMLYKHNPEIQELIKKIYEDINYNSEHESFVEFDDSQYIVLRISQTHQLPIVPPIKYCHIPFPIVNIRTGVQTNFNPILIDLIPEINGVNTVGAICLKLKKYKSDYIKLAIKEMIEYNLLRLVDIIKLTNIYVLNQQYFQHEFKENDIKHLLNVDSIQQKYSIISLNTMQQILRTLYLQFNRHVTLQEYIKNNQQYLEIVSLTRLIRYGEINNFLVRLHEYIFACNQSEQKKEFENIFEQPLENYVKVWEKFNEIEKDQDKDKEKEKEKENEKDHEKDKFKDKYKDKEKEKERERKEQQQKLQQQQQQQQKQQQLLLSQLMNSSLDYSQEFELGNQSPTIPKRLKDDQKIKDSNETIKIMIQNQECLDEICFAFNLELDQIRRLIDQKDYTILHR